MELSLNILACSGPGAGQAIARNIALGYYFAAATGIIVIWLFRLRSRTGRDRPAYWGVALFVLHPAWTISAIRGDCGSAKVTLSCVVILIVTAVLVLQLLAFRRYKKLPDESMPPR